MTNRKIQYWVIPPEADAEFVAHMEEVLETYEKPYNPAIPVLCMDEQPVQLIKEIKTPIDATLEHARRVDYEYERAGTANIFMFAEPLAGWREVAVRERKTKIDWATEMARLLEGRYVGCEKVILVSDNLNTHTKGAFYETFDPERARDLVRRIDFLPYTKTRQLAEHRRKRTEFPNTAVRRRSTNRRRRNATRRDRRPGPPTLPRYNVASIGK